jgi:hypothetical protein
MLCYCLYVHAQLKELYIAGEEGSWAEFTSYRILYYLVLQSNQVCVTSHYALGALLSETPCQCTLQLVKRRS